MAQSIGKVKVRIRTTFKEELVDDGSGGTALYKRVTPDVTIEQISMSDFQTQAIKHAIVQFMKRNPNAKAKLKGYRV